MSSSRNNVCTLFSDFIYYMKMGDSEIISGEWKNFYFKKIEPSDHSKVIEHSVKYLFPSITVLGYDPSNTIEVNDWVTIIKALLNDGNNLNFMAIDKESGKIASIRIIGVVKRSDPEVVPIFQHKNSNIIMNFLVELGETCKIFAQYPQYDRYADFFGVSVDPQFRQQGLCTEMYRRALLWCQSNGFSLAKVAFSSPYSRKAGRNFGFKELGRRLCIDCKDERGQPLNPSVNPIWYLDMGVFEF